MPKAATKTRSVFRADVDAKTAEKFAVMCEETGVSQIAVASRLVQWFCRQDEHTQLCVLGMLGADKKATAAKEYLQRVARDGISAI